MFHPLGRSLLVMFRWVCVRPHEKRSRGWFDSGPCHARHGSRRGVPSAIIGLEAWG